jgi:hypothetical protein
MTRKRGQSGIRVSGGDRPHALPGLRPKIETLISALRASGQQAQADRFHQMFAEMDDQALQPAHLDMLVCLLDAGQIPNPQAPPQPSPGPIEVATKPAPTPASPAPPPLPDRHAPIRPHLPFLDAIPHGRQILDLLDELGSARTGEQVEAILRAILTEYLGYQPARLDQTSRLGGKASYKRFVTLATHGRFAISLLETANWDWHSTKYERCFQVEPYGLVIAVTPGVEAIRFVFRKVRGESDAKPWYRTFQGRFLGRDANDNLLVWCHRLHRLRPRFGDSDAKLRDRAQAALQVSAADIAVRWASTPFPANGHEPPASTLTAAYANAAASFAQPTDHEPRLHWGLQAALRNQFPTPLYGGKLVIHYESYQLSMPSTGTVETWRQGGSHCADVLLHLAVEHADGTRAPMKMRCSLPLPDEQGCFVLRGQLLRFQPQVDEEGRLSTRLIDEPEGELEDDFLSELEGSDNGALADEDDGENTNASAPDPSDQDTGLVLFSGASLEALLGYAVERKLHGVLRQLTGRTWKDEPPTDDIVERVRLLFLPYLDDHDRFCLGALSWLHANLQILDTPDDLERLQPTVGSDPAEGPPLPPAWACPDVAAYSSPRSWLPVSSARLHPAGLLCVPRLTDDGQAELAVPTRTMLDINPRLSGDGAGPSFWWIHSALQRWATLEPGRIEHADLLAEQSVELPDLQCVLVSGTKVRAVANPATVPITPRGARYLVVDLPWHPTSEGEPAFLVGTGEPIGPEQPWASCPLGLWPHPTNPKPSQIERLLQRSAKANGIDLLENAPGPKLFRAPTHAKGIVTSTQVARIDDRYGVPRGWRLTLCYVPEKPAIRWIALPAGQLVPLETAPSPCTLPWRMDGSTADVLIVVPFSFAETADAATPIWFSGDDGELIPRLEEQVGARVYTPATPVLHPPALHTERRLLDLEPLPPPPPGQALTPPELLSWLARDPESYAASLKATPGRRELPCGWFQRLVQALPAADLDPPACAPEPWRVSRYDRPVGSRKLPDPTATAVKYANEDNPPSKAFQPLFSWRCSCGATDRSQAPLAPCPHCDEQAAPRSRDQRDVPVWRFALPIAVLNPWTVGLAAAQLGLTTQELELLVDRHGPVPVARLLEESDQAPGDLAMRRLSLPDDHPRALTSEDRRRLGGNLYTLLAHGIRNALVLRHITILPVFFQPNAFPVGVPAQVSTLITKAYRRVSATAKRLGRLNPDCSPVLRLAAEHDLQVAVNELFGSWDQRDYEGPTGTLASLLLRLLPWTRSQSLRQGWPGLLGLAGRPESDSLQEMACASVRWPFQPDESDPTESAEREPPDSEPDDTVQVEQAIYAIVDALPPSAINRLGRRHALVGSGNKQRRRTLAAIGPFALVNALRSNELQRVAVRLGLASTKQAHSLAMSTLRRNIVATVPSTVEEPEAPEELIQDDADCPRGFIEIAFEPHPHIQPWAILGDHAVPIPGAPKPLHPPLDEQFWSRRHDQEILRGHTARLIALLGGLDAPAAPRLLTEDLKLPDELPLPGLAALVAASHILEQPTSNPSPLLELLILRVPLYLPSDPERAAAALEQRLIESIPGAGPASRLARRALVASLGGWWLGPPSEECPLGWKLLPHDQVADKGWRRAVPSTTSAGWTLWPGMAAVTAPLRFLAGGAVVASHWSPALMLMFGQHQELPDLPDWLTEDDERPYVDDQPDVPPVEPTPAPVHNEPIQVPDEPEEDPSPPEPGAASDVRVLPFSIADWLSSHTRGQHD